MRLLYAVLIILCVNFFFQRCANPASPTGGPKDTIPPTLIYSYPSNGQTNFTEQELTLEFSEYINADKLKQSLIITPKTEVSFKHIIKRNQLIIKLNEPLADSTTYNFNFSDGVTDITEKNPAVNLSLAFSTGTYIDSMSIKGEVIDLFSQENAKGYTIGLYPLTDTLDYLTQSPVYFTTSNDSGKFSLSYIKSGTYKIITFNDENKNVILDPADEAHGFIAASIKIDSAITIEKPIRTLLQNVKPLSLINSRPTGPYVELKYNKPINSYTLKPDYLYHNLSGDKKDIIKLYRGENISYNDSLTIHVIAKDTLGNIANDTIKIVFLESNRKPSTFSMAIETEKYYSQDQEFKFVFNKPIKFTDTTKFYFVKDTTLNYPITPTLNWNSNKTELKITSSVSRDTLIHKLQDWMVGDTTISELQRTNRLKTIDFISDTGAFISVENDSSKRAMTSIELNQKESYGTVKFTITTDEKSYAVQLIDKKNNVLYEKWNLTSFSFPKVNPATYTIRVLIDENNDGLWSQGNLLKNIEPETVYLYPEETAVRENWVIELQLSF